MVNVVDVSADSACVVQKGLKSVNYMRESLLH